MNQDQQPQRWWKRAKDNWLERWWKRAKDNRLAWALAALPLASLVITTILGYWLGWAWTELLWRWLELLIIPLVLALGALWFNRQERREQNAIETRRQESEQALAEDRAREEALQRYLDTMQELILDKELRRSERDAEIRNVARVRTLAVLRSLDGNRKGQVTRFLHEADLIGKAVREEAGEWRVTEASIIDLRDADISGANLIGANLIGAILSHANLIDAKLMGAYLSDAKLSDAKLIGADLSAAKLDGDRLSFAMLDGADLTRAILSHANLIGAYLSQANLTGARLDGADLRSADLTRAILSHANLIGANLEGAKGWTKEQLAQAASLVEATLPDVTTLTEEAWDEFKTRYRQ